MHLMNLCIHGFWSQSDKGFGPRGSTRPQNTLSKPLHVAKPRLPSRAEVTPDRAWRGGGALRARSPPAVSRKTSRAICPSGPKPLAGAQSLQALTGNNHPSPTGLSLGGNESRCVKAFCHPQSAPSRSAASLLSGRIASEVFVRGCSHPRTRFQEKTQEVGAAWFHPS